MSAGIRSGVHWMRAKGRFEAVREALDGPGLGEAGRALDQQMPVRQKPDEQPLDQDIAADQAVRKKILERDQPLAVFLALNRDRLIEHLCGIHDVVPCASRTNGKFGCQNRGGNIRARGRA